MYWLNLQDQIYSKKADFPPLLHNMQNELCPELHVCCVFGRFDLTFWQQARLRY